MLRIRANRSQMDSPLPSVNAAPSICGAAVVTPQAKCCGNAYGLGYVFGRSAPRPRALGLSTLDGMVNGGMIRPVLQSSRVIPRQFLQSVSFVSCINPESATDGSFTES